MLLVPLIPPKVSCPHGPGVVCNVQALGLYVGGTRYLFGVLHGFFWHKERTKDFGVHAHPCERNAKARNDVGRIVHTQIDAADANKEDEDGKPRDAAAHRGSGKVNGT